MQSEQEDKEKSHTCPITQNVVFKCPVTTCMWNNANYKNNCSINDINISEYDLGQTKGFSIASVNKHIRKGKSEIVKLLTLDKYIEFIKSSNIEIKLRGKRYIKDIFKQTVLKNNIFCVDYRVFAKCCIPTLYEDFKAKNPELKKSKLSFLLGVRENKLRNIQKLIKVKK